MFGPLKALFRNSEPSTNVIDKVWMSADAKFNACIAMARANSACVFICWFPETYEKLQQSLPDEQLVLADRASAHTYEGRMIVFAEHHPLGRKEAALYKSLNLAEAPVLSSLDEPLFMRFGGDRTIDIMKRLGMKEDEVVGSSLITKALRNAQRKIEEQVTIERDAHSQQEWMKKNLPPSSSA